LWREKVAAAAPDKPKAGRSWREKHGGTSWTLKQRAQAKADSQDWRDESGDNLFALSPAQLEYLKANRLAAQWAVMTVMGADIEQLMPVGDQRRYWTFVEPGDIPGLQSVERGGCRLMVRPIELQEKIEEHHRKEAAAKVLEREQAMLSGELTGITLDPRHPSARASNKIAHNWERINVPQD
jgi:hypothetical protein